MARDLALNLSRVGMQSDKPSATECVECDEPIPNKRRELLPGVQLCVDCAQLREMRRRR